uniref:Uncharacterized protein n=2 Tax=Aegilops tauschii subsp. strangulata TaxID=200361 RepID=A0A453Q652_AEGTS
GQLQPMGTVSSRGCHCIQDLSSSIQIIIAMEDLLKQQFQEGFPPTVLPTGVACDATCSIDANPIICLWCARPLAVCSATPCSPNLYVHLTVFDSGTACTHVVGVI